MEILNINFHLQNGEKMEIRKSTINDLDEMLNIFKIAKKFMIETGNPNQWTDNYPSVQMIENDINKNIKFLTILFSLIPFVLYIKNEIIEKFIKVTNKSWKKPSLA